MNSRSLSFDLILQILSRLPAKSVARFRCVSKLWAASLCGSPNFTNLFLTRSSAKPHLLFAIFASANLLDSETGVWRFFSLPQLQNPYEKSSSTLVVAAEFHVKFSPDIWIHYYDDPKYFSCGYASGLIYFHGNRYDGYPLICNPNTGRYAVLPHLKSYRKSYSFFGFEPIDKQYKVLFVAYPSGPGHDKILTIGSGDMRWRRIECPLQHEVRSEGICINGVLYYVGDTLGGANDGYDATSEYVIVCFHVRSEKFTFIDVERFCRLINYKGKLAVIYWEDDVDIYSYDYEEDDVDIYSNDYVEDDVDIYSNDYVEDDVDIYSNDFEDDVEADAINELHVWVLEDVEKQEWSKYAYTLSDDNFVFSRHDVSFTGVTAWGEIVFSMREYTSKQPFYVFYFNPERNTLRRVEIQGFGEEFKELCNVCTFVDHVEDLNVNDLKVLNSVNASLVMPEFLESSSDSD